MHVKVCGITRLEDARVAAEAGADFIGLIRAASRRQVALADAALIAAALPSTLHPVLVFMNQPYDEIAAALRQVPSQWVQLHGSEPVAMVRYLQTQHPGLHVIKAWEISGVGSVDLLQEYLEAARDTGATIDAVLLDSPKLGEHPGYDCLAAVAGQLADCYVPIWCAGGLNPGNVAQIVSGHGYAGVDVASGVESSPGIKDPDAIRRFVSAARQLG
ncbi:MAG: phosphoribosylanthranilate isomerase [Phycisphaerae bacterium]|nr:phosphoribosylanthranilate isomerase [Phycisphaerae bacterium]